MRDLDSVIAKQKELTAKHQELSYQYKKLREEQGNLLAKIKDTFGTDDLSVLQSKLSTLSADIDKALDKINNFDKE